MPDAPKKTEAERSAYWWAKAKDAAADAQAADRCGEMALAIWLERASDSYAMQARCIDRNRGRVLTDY